MRATSHFPMSLLRKFRHRETKLTASLTQCCLLLVKSRHGVSVAYLLQWKRLCRSISPRESAGLDLKLHGKFCSDKTATLTQNITTIESKFPWCEVPNEDLSFALLASEFTQNAKMSWTRCCYSARRSVCCFRLSQASFDRFGILVSKTTESMVACNVCRGHA